MEKHNIDNKKIKVLHILWSGRSGGAEKFVSDITIYSDKERFEHEVCFLSQGGWVAERIANNGIKVHYIGMRSGFSIINSIQLLRVISQTKPHIINTHNRNYIANIIVLLFSRIPKVHFEHGGHLIGENPKREIVFYNCFGRFYDLILANSNYVKDKIMKLTKVNPQKIKTFYIGIDPEKYKIHITNNMLKVQLGIPEGNKIVGMVGRLVELKGVDDFMKVASEINKIYEKCSFVIVGDGYLRPSLEQISIDYNFKIKFLGDRSDVPNLLNMFDIFLITSKWESFGIVVLEAMAAKVPVVGFAVPGMKEIIEKGGGGILIKDRNHRKCAEIIINLLEDKNKYNKLSDQGHTNVIDNFDIRKNIKNLETEYNLIAGKRLVHSSS